MRRKEQEGLEGRQEELGKVKTHKGVVLSDTPQPNTSVSPPGCAGVISKIKTSQLSCRHSSYTKPPCSSPLHLHKRQLHSSNCSNKKHDGHVNTCIFLTSQLIYHDILLDLTSNTTYSEFDLFI